MSSATELVNVLVKINWKFSLTSSFLKAPDASERRKHLDTICVLHNTSFNRQDEQQFDVSGGSEKQIWLALQGRILPMILPLRVRKSHHIFIVQPKYHDA